MTFKGLILRLIAIALLTWIIAGFTHERGWALYFALMPFVFYEMYRPR